MIKKQLDEKTGRIHNLLIRSHEERMTADFVYGETKMIEVQKNYVITFTEDQARELYRLLQTEKDSGCLTPDRELKLVYHELENIFDTKIR